MAPIYVIHLNRIFPCLEWQSLCCWYTLIRLGRLWADDDTFHMVFQSWEVLGQVIGLLAGVELLSYAESDGDWQKVLGSWIVVRTVHIILRYCSLGILNMKSINVARGKKLAQLFIAGSTLPNTRVMAESENFMLDWIQVQPTINFGCTVDAAFSMNVPGRVQITFSEWVSLFSEEMYILGWWDSKGWVVLKEDATSLDYLKALYHCVILNSMETKSGSLVDLRGSLKDVQGSFPDFADALGLAGWDIDDIVIQASSVRIRDIV